MRYHETCWKKYFNLNSRTVYNSSVKTENHNYTITTNTSQHVKFFHSLIFRIALSCSNETCWKLALSIAMFFSLGLYFIIICQIIITSLVFYTYCCPSPRALSPSGSYHINITCGNACICFLIVCLFSAVIGVILN